MISGRFSRGTRSGGGLLHHFPSVLFGFSSLFSFLTMNAPPRAFSGDRPQLAGRDPTACSRAGGGGLRRELCGPSRDGPGPQLTVRVGMGSRWTGRRPARVPRSRPGGSSPLRASCGGRGGAGSPDGEGTPFSMTMPRRLVQRRRNQRFIGSS